MGRIAKKIKNKSMRKFFSSDSYDRNLELMTLLTTDSKFQKMVAEARERLNIPPDGIDGSDSKAIEKWYDWLVTESDRVLESEDYNFELRTIRQQYKDKIIGPGEARELGKKNDDKMPVNHFGNIANLICKKFNLPIHFKEFIQGYLLTAKIDAPQHNYQGGFYEPFQRPWEAGYIPINIYTQLTKDEWDELKHYVDDVARMYNLPRHPRIRKIEKYVEVEKAYVEGKQKNAGRDYELTSAEIAEMLFDNPSKDNKVRDIVRKIENLRKNRLTPKDRGKK